MLLRSSSTPMLGSLMAENPNSSHHHNQQQHHFYCCLSPLSDSSPTPSGVRRTRSDGNLHSLLSGDHHPRSNPVLETIPSFSVYNSNKHPQAEKEDELEEEEEDEVVEEEEGDYKGVLHHEFSFSGGNKQGPLFLARGLGIDRLGSGMMNYSAGGERSEMEMYYKKMVDEEPSNALVLRNYAQFLFETKGDLERAEEYYSRAILAGPGDGEVLSQYAKVVWELHRDEERACAYFEQAVQAAPHDSHVAAAYAVFLWEIEDDGGDDDHYNGAQVSYGALASATATATA